MSMLKDEKITKCNGFFEELVKALDNKYSVIGSCNEDLSRYLVPVGTESSITYYDKPRKSFRISDHWNWYANLNKCQREHYVQCLNIDLPRAKNRTEPGKASKPVYGIQVALTDEKGIYHVVYGEKYNKLSHQWEWIENDAEAIAKVLLA